MTQQALHTDFTNIPAAQGLAQPKEPHDGWSPLGA